MSKLVSSTSKQYSNANASSALLNQTGLKGDRNVKVAKSAKATPLSKSDKKLKKSSSVKSFRNSSEQQLNLLTQKYCIGKTIGRGVDSVVKVCKIRKEWNNKNIGNKGAASDAKSDNNNKEDIGGNNNINNINNNTSNTGKTIGSNNDDYDQIARLRAMKIVDKTKLPKQQISDIYNEMNILKQLAVYFKNDHIVRCYECFETQNRAYIVTELLTGDTLENKIVGTYNYANNHIHTHTNSKTSSKQTECVTEYDAAIIFEQVLKALDRLHSLNIVHRDIKPENFVFTGANSNTKVLKLIDFGLATTVSKHNERELSRICGTPLYVAPEMIQKQQYGTKVDMWAAGLILYFLLCGYLPFKLRSNDKMSVLYKQILKANIPMLSPQWYNRSVYAKDLIRKLLTRDPTQRYSAAQALQHPWFKVTFGKKNKIKNGNQNEKQ